MVFVNRPCAFATFNPPSIRDGLESHFCRCDFQCESLLAAFIHIVSLLVIVGLPQMVGSDRKGAGLRKVVGLV
jgi:hypothetical protein